MAQMVELTRSNYDSKNAKGYPISVNADNIQSISPVADPDSIGNARITYINGDVLLIDESMEEANRIINASK